MVHIILVKTSYEIIRSVLITSLMNKTMYQNFLFLDDFNATTHGKCIEEFCNLNGLTKFD